MNKVQVCKNVSDIRIMIKELELNPLKKQITKEEYIKLWLESEQRAKDIWEGLIMKNKKFFERDGFLEVEYMGNGKYRRKPLSKGQPKKENTKEKRIVVRITQEQEERLNEYCKKHNISISDAMRLLIDRL